MTVATESFILNSSNHAFQYFMRLTDISYSELSLIAMETANDLKPSTKFVRVAFLLQNQFPFSFILI
ncbi:MAG: hypothetical protein ACTSRZ_14250 [Promethearchaeota archaeon]